MELQCPSCQKKLAIAEQFAGQMIKCPSCGGMFLAPALPVKPVIAIPVAPPIAPPVASVEHNPGPPPIPFNMEPPVVPPGYPPTPPPPYTPPLPPRRSAEPEIEIPPGDYTKTRTFRLEPEHVRWTGPVAVTLLFLLSFGHWAGSLNVWEAAFGSHDHSLAFIFYMLLTMILGLPLTWVKLAFEKNWIPLPDALKPIWPWRAVIVGGVLGLAFLILAFLWLSWNLVSVNEAALSLKLGVRVHLVAVLAYAAEYWLDRRRRSRLPLPEATFRW